MSRNTSPVSWILLMLAVGGLPLLYIVEEGSRRKETQLLTSQLLRSVRSSEEKAEGESTELKALLRSLRRDLDSLSQRVSKPQVLAKAESNPEAEPSEAAEPAAPSEKENEKLPPLPVDVNAELAIKGMNVEEFFSNPNFNPEKVTPSRVETMAAIHELNAARANMEILNSQIQLSVAKALETLKEGGHFLEYQPGQAPEAVEGVLSAGESLEGGGMRMYYFYPEDFPEIYETKEKVKEVAETAFRRLLSMVNA